MWYFSENNERQGPVGLEEMQELVMQGRVTRGTLVWQKGMAEWKVAEETEIKRLLDLESPSRMSQQDSSFYSPPFQLQDHRSILIQIGQINAWFHSYWMTLVIICPTMLFGCGILLGLTSSELLDYYTATDIGTVIGLCMVSLIFLAGTLFGYLIIFQCWKAINSKSSPTTPSKAVGFLFIPVFSLYWQFVAIYGLAKEMNRHAKRRRIDEGRVNEALALSYCIVTCTYIIPVLNSLTVIAGFILWIILLNSLRKSAVSILESKLVEA